MVWLQGDEGNEGVYERTIPCRLMDRIGSQAPRGRFGLQRTRAATPRSDHEAASHSTNARHVPTCQGCCVSGSFVRGSNVRSHPSSASRRTVTARAGARKPVLLVSDLDGTMVGDDSATRRFREFWLREHAPIGSKIVYSTGRPLTSFEELAESFTTGDLLEPDGLICSVGTRLYERSSEGDWQANAAWLNLLNYNWDAEEIVDLLEEAINDVGGDSAHLRPEDEQNSHKITAGVRAECVDRFVSVVREGISALGLKAKVITSGVGDWRFVDVLSFYGGKGESLEYVRELLGFECHACIACGDSGNDLLMFGSDNLGVLVGNSQPDVVAWYEESASNEEAFAQRVYYASAGHADGIIEGLEHFSCKM